MKNNTNSGFTIIEVVLVLAIAGLIFLMVFVAYPNLARNRRDTQRRNDYAMLATEVSNYKTNSRGKLPSTGSVGGCPTSFLSVKNYKSTLFGSDGKDPSGRDYKIYCYAGTQINAVNENGERVLNPLSRLQPLSDSDSETKVQIIGSAHCGGDDGLTPVIDTYKNDASVYKHFVIYAQLETGIYCSSSDR